jgi:subtilisin family serine protease
MRSRWVVGSIVAVGLASLAAPAAASAASRSIVRIRSGVDGWDAIQAVCALLACQVSRSLDGLPGETGPSSLFLVQDLPEISPLLAPQVAALGVEAIEVDLPVAVASDEEGWGADQATAGVLDQLWDQTPVSYFGAPGWESYIHQPAADIVRLGETQCTLGATGSTTVAVIDTGIDPGHSTLAPFLTGGYDFTRDVPGGDEKADVDQATAGVLDGIYTLNNATIAVLDQATAGVLDDSRYSHFGHGTMVAGVVHLVAPTATIMPLKAFGADGQGYTSDILRAIYYAMHNGAKVLNMSFSRPTSSAELARAIGSATEAGLIAVASAGNDGQAVLKYPAAYDNVMGVASTANDDTRSTFSNYGSSLVWVAAPGEAIVTTFPWGSFAAAWGTSFSAPFVSGTAALLTGIESDATYADVSFAVSRAQPLTPELGHGRLDIYQAVQFAHVLWPDATPGQAPDSCEWSPAP